jgi:hypothetical protein
MGLCDPEPFSYAVVTHRFSAPRKKQATGGKVFSTIISDIHAIRIPPFWIGPPFFEQLLNPSAAGNIFFYHLTAHLCSIFHPEFGQIPPENNSRAAPTPLA